MLPQAVGRWWRRRAGEVVQRSWERARSLGALHPESARAGRFGSLGRGSLIGFPTTALFGERSIHLGEETLVGPWVTLTAGYVPDSQVLIMTDASRAAQLPNLSAYEGRRFDFRVWWVRDWGKLLHPGAWWDWFTRHEAWNPTGGMDEWLYVRRDVKR